MSQLGDYFDHGADRIGYNPGSVALPEYAHDEHDAFYATACPTLLAYLNHSVDDIHVALARISVDTRLKAFPPTQEGLEESADVAQRHLVPEMLAALAHAACVGSGSVYLHSPPEDHGEFTTAWEMTFAGADSQANIGLIRDVWNTDSELMEKITGCLASATYTIRCNLREGEDALDIWHRASHLASVACYLIGFEMGKKMSFDSKVSPEVKS